MHTYSACVPSTRWPNIQPPSSQCEYMPFLQYSHLPQEVMQDINTWSPFLKLPTAFPTSSMTPTPSWPIIRPSVTSGTSPFIICRSVPHMVVLRIFTTASVGFNIVGLGLSSHAFLPGP